MIVILVTFVIGTIFFNWGMNAGGPGGKINEAGTINGKKIPLQAFDQEVSSERQRLQSNQGDVPPYQYHMVPKNVWEREVQKVLVNKVIEDLKLTATIDEIYEHLKNNPLPGLDTSSAFQTNGVFDTSKYVAFLNDPKNYETYAWMSNIEDFAKSSVTGGKLEKLLNAGAMPSRSEVEYAYKRANSRVQFEYAKVNSMAVNPDVAKITDAEIEKYYTSHKDSFNVDNQVNLYYVKFPKAATSADDKFYYEQLLELKKTIEASNKVGEMFAEEAKIQSDDEGSAPLGGDLNWFGHGQMVPEFDSAAFKLDSGKISDPIRSQFGYHLIYVEGKKKEGGQDKVKARHILKKIVPTIESLDILAERADSVRSLMLENGFAETAKKQAGVEFDSTGLYKKGEMVPKVGYVSGLGNFAYSENKDATISERLENNDGYYLFAIKQSIKKGILPLADVKERITNKLLDSLRKDSSLTLATNVRNGLNDTVSLANLQQTDSRFSSGVTDSISVGGYVQGIGNDTKVATVAEALSVGQLSQPVEFQGTYYIVKLKWKQEAPTFQWDSPDVKMFAEQLKAKNQQRMYYNWFMTAKNKSKIVSNIDNIYLD
jgi:peptidyl-prolyl cis-trans isomerase D